MTTSRFAVEGLGEDDADCVIVFFIGTGTDGEELDELEELDEFGEDDFSVTFGNWNLTLR